VARIQLNSEALRRPSPPQSPRGIFLPDSANLPWMIYTLEQNHSDQLQRWVAHVRTALPNVQAITTYRREEDNHRYLAVEYDTGLTAPAWLVSDGTLRMLALTLLGYLPDLNGIYLIEEPENGIHPKAVETVVQALSNLYDSQVFLATHSPVVLSLTDTSQLLCFDRTPAGETDIVRGDLHPRLATWQGEVSLSTLYAAGVLG
jgi:predicted ATPase